MIHKVLALILLLLAAQLAQGLAIAFEQLKLTEEVLMAHIGLGILIFIILLGATYSSRREKHPASPDITFTFSLYMVQGAFGFATRIGGETGQLLSTIHLYTSVITLMASAAALVISLSERK